MKVELTESHLKELQNELKKEILRHTILFRVIHIILNMLPLII